MAAFVPHRPNKYFHVTASNGIVSSSPYTPLAIMTASPIASVRVFETVRDADVGSLRSVRPQRRRCKTAVKDSLGLNSASVRSSASRDACPKCRSATNAAHVVARPCSAVLRGVAAIPAASFGDVLGIPPAPGRGCGFRGLRPLIPIERDHAVRSKAATCSDEGGRGVVAGIWSGVRFSWLRQVWRAAQ
jgi:hypothetical protein